MKKNLLVVALGGNAIKQAHEAGTTEEQLRNVDIAAEQMVSLIQAGYSLVITHGNGPQAGTLLIQQEQGKETVPAQSLAVCGAMTQGQIGWMLQNRLSFHLQLSGIDMPVCTVVTQVEVDPDDPDFASPSKPVGPFYSEREGKELRELYGWDVKEVKPGAEKGWRRVVPSPEPMRIVEAGTISHLVMREILVIASGGGGIPVAQNGDGSLSGIDAVIDKDKAGFKLAEAVSADKFIILTDVEFAYSDYNTDRQKAIGTLHVEEAEELKRRGQFYDGSMGPKIEACIRFVKWGGDEAIITSLDKALIAVNGVTGTRIVP
jgi:carbamate kinase